jgi:hypothetical protein
MMWRLLPFLLCLLAWGQVPDQQIEAQLRERLARSVIGKDGFTARVKAGVVYWDGATPVAQHKGAATRMAKSSGARRVVNNIRVNGAKSKPVRMAAVPATPPSPTTAAPPPQPPAAAPSPAPRTVKVQWKAAKQ